MRLKIPQETLCPSLALLTHWNCLLTRRCH
jgi:hypothetical protein